MMDKELSGRKPVCAEDCIGARIRDVRCQRGYPQDKMAAQLGISTSHLCNLEYGRKKPSIEIIIAVARLLDVSLDYLILGREQLERRIDPTLIFRSDDELVSLTTPYERVKKGE